MSLRSVVRGIIAGVSVKFFMQYVIIPLGHAASPHYNWVSLTNNLLAHIFFFGLPVLLIARRAHTTPHSTAGLREIKARLSMNRREFIGARQVSPSAQRYGVTTQQRLVLELGKSRRNSLRHNLFLLW